MWWSRQNLRQKSCKRHRHQFFIEKKLFHKIRTMNVVKLESSYLRVVSPTFEESKKEIKMLNRFELISLTNT